MLIKAGEIATYLAVLDIYKLPDNDCRERREEKIEKIKIFKVVGGLETVQC